MALSGRRNGRTIILISENLANTEAYSLRKIKAQLMVFLPLHKKGEGETGRVKDHLDVEVYNVDSSLLSPTFLGTASSSSF